MKVIFVGMHNKPDKAPLCSSTKSGKLIDRIINELGKVNTMKTNLYDVEYFPTNEQEKYELAMKWGERIDYNADDVIVLLGAEVHVNYLDNICQNVIKIAHPSSKRSHKEMDDYVNSAVQRVKSKL